MKAKNRTNTGLISNWNLETYFGFWWGTCAFQGKALVVKNLLVSAGDIGIWV